MTFVCDMCKCQECDFCDNGPRGDGTWCDCQHRETEK